MKFEVDLTINSGETPAWAISIERKLDQILRQLGLINLKENSVMTSVADIQAKAAATLATVTAETDVVNNVKTIVEHNATDIATLKQQLADAIAAGADPAALQTLSDTLDAIQAAETSNGAVVAAAVAAGTPPAPAPAPSA